MSIEIEQYGRNAIVNADDVAFTFEITDNPRDFDSYRVKQETLDWDHNYNHVGEWMIHPYGHGNDLPSIIKKAVYENNSAPGLLSKKTQLDWGKGPYLYTEETTKEGPKRIWTEDKEIQSWLNDWDYEDYLLRNLVDFNHIEGSFTKIRQSKGTRFGKKRIADLVHEAPDWCRLVSKPTLKRIKPTHAMITDFSLNSLRSLEYDTYPLFDFKNPFAHTTSIFYSNLYTFCSEYYSIPKLYGSLEWLRRSTAIPLILKALSKNSMNIKYHIQSPAEFWEQKRDTLLKVHAESGKVFKEKDLEEYKLEFLRKIQKSLASDKNTGKFFHTEKVFNREGTTMIESGWEINVLDQKVEDFVKAHLEVAKHADYALSANISIHSALGNVSESGKSDSGSEQLYALQNYLLTGVDIPEMIVMKPINYAIKANFPGKNIKMGFYHIPPQREEDKSEKDRVKTQG